MDVASLSNCYTPFSQKDWINNGACKGNRYMNIYFQVILSCCHPQNFLDLFRVSKRTRVSSRPGIR